MLHLLVRSPRRLFDRTWVSHTLEHFSARREVPETCALKLISQSCLANQSRPKSKLNNQLQYSWLFDLLILPSWHIAMREQNSEGSPKSYLGGLVYLSDQQLISLFTSKACLLLDIIFVKVASDKIIANMTLHRCQAFTIPIWVGTPHLTADSLPAYLLKAHSKVRCQGHW